MAIALEIGPLSFPSKSAASEHFRTMLYRHGVGSYIPDPDASELGWLLERHPEYGEKLGPGIKGFRVRKAVFGTLCFEVVRTDGSTTDFSFNSCVEGKRPSELTEAITALRAEVTDDIMQKKREWFRDNGDHEGKVACAITGARITIDQAHADHAPPRPFGTLAIAFLEARGIAPDRSFVSPPADNQYQPRLTDRALAEIWRAYHHKIAVLRIIEKKASLSSAHEGKVKSKDKQLRMNE